MPMVGVIDPRGKEAIPHPNGLPEWFTPEQILEALQTDLLGESHWTYETAAAAFANVQDRGDMISTTAITAGCPRSIILERKEDYIGDLNELWASLRGTLMHRTLELFAHPNSIVEHRFNTTIDGIAVSGAPDQLTEKSLIDYKVPADQNTIPMSYLYSNQVEQLMINAYICRHAESWSYEGVENPDLPFDPRGLAFESVGIVFIGPKRPKIMVYKRSEEVIGANGKTKKVRLPYVWNDAETLEAIRPRLHLLKEALKTYPSFPEPYTDPVTDITYKASDVWGGVEESWACPGWPACKFMTCLAKREQYIW